MEGDIILAEPDALTAFAGPRVIEQNMHRACPRDFSAPSFCWSTAFAMPLFRVARLRSR